MTTYSMRNPFSFGCHTIKTIPYDHLISTCIYISVIEMLAPEFTGGSLKERRNIKPKSKLMIRNYLRVKFLFPDKNRSLCKLSGFHCCFCYDYELSVKEINICVTSRICAHQYEKREHQHHHHHRN